MKIIRLVKCGLLICISLLAGCNGKNNSLLSSSLNDDSKEKITITFK